MSDSQPTLSSTADGPHGTPNDALRLAPGQQFGPYRIERLLGRGGMGEVYEAEHLEYGRRLALKVLSQRLSDPTDRARFLREGQLAAAVNHPHVVYIYGSEEISGVPAIAMELLPGGTLKNQVENKGPLAPIEAIDAILQVVSGLEAAHRAGILHRDIKPSNCFIDGDGTVKIGDFGLSIPTLARDVTQLTMTGTVQGTPQFASPEQLRGRPLDVRSDIYAVGATLYYLLTGRPPFDDRDLMVLVSRIATEPPTSPREARPEIPRALTALVLECLAKDPADRPASYRVLSNVLEPLSSTAKPPAPLGIRTAAGAFDKFLATFLLTIPVVLLAGPPSAFDTRHVAIHLVEVVYFAITESVWGASLGKAFCGLRVVTEHGARPRFGRALFRALVFSFPGWFASGVVLLIAGLVYSQGSGPITAVVVEYVVLALLFVPARRANGLAGIHEWVSHTRTVLKSPVQARLVVQSVPAGIEVAASPRWVGPYRLVDTLPPQPNARAVVGYDERLRRAVWLHFPGVGSDPVPSARRILGRPARSRWLAGQRTSGLAWDAYEHVPGRPFHTLVTQAQPWGTVREWICDLAAEVSAGHRDGAPADFELNRVWIGDDGRARMLDWSLCDNRPDAGGSPPDGAVDLPHAQRFLQRVAVSALAGSVLADNDSHDRTPRVPLPLPVVDFLAKLGEQRFTTPEEMSTGAISAARGPAAVSRTRRALHLVLCAILPTTLLALSLHSVYRQMIVPPRAHPYVRSVNDGEVADRAGVKANDAVVAVDGEPMTFASQLSAAIKRNPDQPITLSILRDGQPLMIRVTPARSANQGLLGIVIANEEGPEMSPKVTWRYLWLHAIVGLMLAGTLGLLSALATRGGIALRLMSIAVVTRNGTLASGSRARLRAVLSWLPVLAASAAAFAGHAPLLTLTPQAAPFFAIIPSLPPVFLGDVPPIFFPSEPSIPFVRVAIITAALVVVAVGAMSAVIRPERGLQDRLAGTWLVPR